MKNYVQAGSSLTWTNGTGADVASGDVVVIGQSLGIAGVDIPSLAAGTVSMVGVFTAPKTAGAAIDQGTAPIWDVSAGAFVPAGTATATGDVSGAVVAWDDAAAASTTVLVKLAGPGTVAA